MLAKHALALVIATTGLACSEDHPELWTAEGYQQLYAGDAKTARRTFARALDALEPSDPYFARAALGLVETEVHLAPPEAVDRFLRFAAGELPIGAAEYARFARLLWQEEALTEAMVLVQSARRRFPDDRGLAHLEERLAEDMSAASDVLVPCLYGY